MISLCQVYFRSVIRHAALLDGDPRQRIGEFFDQASGTIAFAVAHHGDCAVLPGEQAGCRLIGAGRAHCAHSPRPAWDQSAPPSRRRNHPPAYASAGNRPVSARSTGLANHATGLAGNGRKQARSGPGSGSGSQSGSRPVSEIWGMLSIRFGNLARCCVPLSTLRNTSQLVSNLVNKTLAARQPQRAAIFGYRDPFFFASPSR